MAQSLSGKPGHGAAFARTLVQTQFVPAFHWNVNPLPPLAISSVALESRPGSPN
jgi:hypothetical protein